MRIAFFDTKAYDRDSFGQPKECRSHILKIN